MNFVKGRKTQALQSIVQGPVPESAAAFPEFITLPPLITDIAGEIADHSEEQRNNLSVSFRYLSSRGLWRASRKATVGTGLYAYGGSIRQDLEPWSLPGLFLRRPHIWLHVHLDPSSDQAQEELGKLNKKLTGEYPLSGYPLVDPKDVDFYTQEAGGTVGNIIASRGGIMLLLWPRVRRLGSAILRAPDGEHVDELKQAYRSIGKQTHLYPEDVRNRMLFEAATTLEGLFVCYFSDKIDRKAPLHRIDPVPLEYPGAQQY
jgi:hypothetical protein